MHHQKRLYETTLKGVFSFIGGGGGGGVGPAGGGGGVGVGAGDGPLPPPQPVRITAVNPKAPATRKVRRIV